MIIIIPTCYEYYDIIKPFGYFFNKFWNDCKYRKIFINSSINIDGFENYQTEDLGWTANLIKFIENENINENILLLLDDYILQQEILSQDIEKIDKDITEKIGYIRLIPYSDNEYNNGMGWKNKSQNSYNECYNYAAIDKLSKKTKLPISLQPAIWNINFIKTYFNKDFSPWQQEVLASREFCKNGTIKGIPCNSIFLTTKDFVYLYCNAIRDGKYSKEFIDLINNTKDLQPFNFVRDIAIFPSKIDKKLKKQLDLRQTDGTYPEKRYIL
jgi:hypothetical protein